MPIVPLLSLSSLQVQIQRKQSELLLKHLFDFCLSGNAAICQAVSLRMLAGVIILPLEVELI